MSKSSHCPDCKATVPDLEGPTHAYFGASAGCWQIYGEIVAREYQDPSYMAAHRLTVDAYAAQHPGRDEARARQSVNIHLVSLHLILDLSWSFDAATRALGRCVELHKGRFEWLAPPPSMGGVRLAGLGAPSCDGGSPCKRSALSSSS